MVSPFSKPSSRYNDYYGRNTETIQVANGNGSDAEEVKNQSPNNARHKSNPMLTLKKIAASV
jgi:hypothetical protein